MSAPTGETVAFRTNEAFGTNAAFSHGNTGRGSGGRIAVIAVGRRASTNHVNGGKIGTIDRGKIAAIRHGNMGPEKSGTITATQAAVHPPITDQLKAVPKQPEKALLTA